MNLNHPNIVRYNYFVSEKNESTNTDTYSIILDYVDGLNLADYIKK